VYHAVEKTDLIVLNEIPFNRCLFTAKQCERRQLPGTHEIASEQGLRLHQRLKTMQLQAFLFKSKTKQCETKTVLSFFIALCQAI